MIRLITRSAGLLAVIALISLGRPASAQMRAAAISRSELRGVGILQPPTRPRPTQPVPRPPSRSTRRFLTFVTRGALIGGVAGTVYGMATEKGKFQGEKILGDTAIGMGIGALGGLVACLATKPRT